MRWLTRRTGLPTAGLWLLAGTLVTTVGNGMHALAVGKVLYDQTGTAAAYGGVIIFEQLVSFCLQFVAGPWVDRGDPRRTCLAVELFRGVVVCGAALAIGLTGQMVGWVFVMTLAIRAAHPFYRAATFSLGPAAVPAEALTVYNGYWNVCLQVGQIVGVLAAAPVLEVAGPTTVFLINGITFFASALTVAVIRLDPVERKVEAARSWARQVFQGWGEIVQFVRAEAGLAWHLLLSTTDAVAVNLFNLVSVPLVAARFGDSAYALSMVSVAYALGAIAGTPLVDRVSDRLGRRGAVVVGIGGQALAFALFALPSAPLLLVWTFVIGLANTLSWTVLTTTLQLRVSRSVKGRIATIRSLLISVSSGLLVPVTSWMERQSVESMVLVCAAACLGFCLVPLVVGRKSALGGRLLTAQATS